MPTRRQLRKEAVEEKRALLPEICVFNPFDEEVTRAAVEAQEKCSETRFERLRDQNAAVAAIQEATDRFAVTHRFAVKTAAKPATKPVAVKAAAKPVAVKSKAVALKTTAKPAARAKASSRSVSKPARQARAS